MSSAKRQRVEDGGMANGVSDGAGARWETVAEWACRVATRRVFFACAIEHALFAGSPVVDEAALRHALSPAVEWERGAARALSWNHAYRESLRETAEARRGGEGGVGRVAFGGAQDAAGFALWCAAARGDVAAVDAILAPLDADQRAAACRWVDTSKFCRPPLVMAARNGHAAVVRRLCAAGANPDFPNGGDGSVDALWFSLGGASFSSDNSPTPATKHTPLHAAARGNHTECIHALLAAGASAKMLSSNRESALHQAAENGSVDTMRLLVQHGADVNAESESGRVPVSHAFGRSIECEVLEFMVREGGLPVSALTSESSISQAKTCVFGDRIELLRTMVRLGVDVFVADYTGSTIASVAARQNAPRVLAELLRLGAPLMGKTRTLLQLAAESTDSTAACVRVLLAAGADPHVVDTRFRTTVLGLVCTRGHLALAVPLVEHGVRVDGCHQVHPGADGTLRSCTAIECIEDGVRMRWHTHDPDEWRTTLEACSMRGALFTAAGRAHACVQLMAGLSRETPWCGVEPAGDD